MLETVPSRTDAISRPKHGGGNFPDGSGPEPGTGAAGNAAAKEAITAAAKRDQRSMSISSGELKPHPTGFVPLRLTGSTASRGR
jgi:hypothetical protein